MNTWINNDPLPNQQPSSSKIQSTIVNALVNLSMCIKQINLYGPNHHMAVTQTRETHKALINLLIIQPSIVLGVADPYLALDNFPVEDNTGNIASLAKLMGDRSIIELRLNAGVTENEIISFAAVLNLTPEELVELGGIEADMKKRNSVHIQVKEGERTVDEDEYLDPADIYDTTLLLIEETMREVRTGKQILISEIRSVISDALYSIMSDKDALVSMVGVRSYDCYLAEHSVNTSILSMVLGLDLGLDAVTTLELGIAAVLHDIGKIFIPDEIVVKTGKLTEDEWEQIRRHPIEGARLMVGLTNLPALAPTIALEHHIYQDGSGYPFLPARHKPHLLSRLVAIVDSYDSLTTDRPFRERITPKQAIASMIYDTPEKYDPQLLARFASRAKLYPIGSIVRLFCGDAAIVIGGDKANPDQPVVRMLSGKKFDTVVNLADSSDLSLEIESVAEPIEAILPHAQKLLS